MQGARTRTGRSPQGGFSMVEMLMTAFVLAIGILGLAMLQAMSLKASRGTRSMTTAIQVGEGVMDRVQQEGRLSWLNLVDTPLTAAPALPATLKYINRDTDLVETFNVRGTPPVAGTGDPADAAAFFTVTTHRVTPGLGSATGQMHDYTVTVTFADAVDGSGATLARTLTLTRRILHG